MGAHTALAVTTGLTALAVIGTILSIISAAIDVKSFFDEAAHDLNEFRHVANSAWQKMTPTPAELVRERRHATINRLTRGSSCGCANQPNHCPGGPAGPRGEPGPPGDDGIDGKDGQNGSAGIAIGKTKAEGCISCPAGPPGQQGADGPPGQPGPNGNPGASPAGTSVSPPGPPGAVGDAGKAGLPGTPGSPGKPGASGKTGKGKPGPSGSSGPAGSAGKPGNDGAPGNGGNDGKIGPAGTDGKPGAPGQDGKPGQLGERGSPGRDSQYCPCPPSDRPAAQSDTPATTPKQPTQPTDGGYNDASKRTIRRPMTIPGVRVRRVLPGGLLYLCSVLDCFRSLAMKVELFLLLIVICTIPHYGSAGCPENEEFWSCISHQHCNDGPLTNYATSCTPGCSCKHGYLRSRADGRCHKIGPDCQSFGNPYE
ncbi:hypothetical protein Q1695_002652 [Nippostrongylus brasiliensis]|nr:hypothetical protein Q1695_002652 [Nippostrongylus brasiliensis]